MSDYSEMQQYIEQRLARGLDVPELEGNEVLALIAENTALRSEVETLQRNTGADMFLMLTGELAEARKKLTTVHFVCDRLPDQDGCRFIELENTKGESLGDESGKWEIRPDGLAQLVVEIANPDVKHLAALLECAQGDLKQAMQIIERQTAERQEWQKVLKMTEIPREGDQSKYSLALRSAGFGDAFYQVAERLGVTGARPDSPMQVFASEVLPALDKAIKDAEIYRFVSQLAWYVDQAAYIYNVGNQRAAWSDDRQSVDADEIEAAIIAAMSKEG